MKKNLLVGLAMLAMAAGASAQATYGVVSVGSSRLNVDCTGTTTCDKTGTAYKLLGGYKFSPNFAAEAGFFGFGKAKASDPTVTAEIANTAFGAGVAFHQDLSADWNLVARVGLASMKTKITGTVVAVERVDQPAARARVLGLAPTIGTVSDSDRNVTPYAGLSIGYKIAQGVSLDGALDFSRSKYNKNGLNESGNLSAVSIGLTFGF